MALRQSVRHSDNLSCYLETWLSGASAMTVEAVLALLLLRAAQRDIALTSPVLSAISRDEVERAETLTVTISVSEETTVRECADSERGQAMAKDSWDAVWERVRLGRHVAVIGPGVLPPTPSDLTVLHVHCEIGATSWGALDAACRKVEQLLGEELLPPESVREPFAMGLRHRFLGDMPGQSLDALLVEACNRLASRTERRAVLAFESIDAADEATVATLAQILKRPGWLRLPLLLTVRGTPQGLVAELIYLLCHEDGVAAVIEIDDEAAPGEDAAPFDWTALSPDVLCVLRAGSVLGTTFEAELVARLLDTPLGVVLEKLQWAADADVPLADRGEGWFSLPPETIAALQSRMLPSLLTFWHTRLGEILRHGRPVGGAAGLAQHSADMARGEPRTVPQDQVVAQAETTFDVPQVCRGCLDAKIRQKHADGVDNAYELGMGSLQGLD
jgi:hypothetical protein